MSTLKAPPQASVNATALSLGKDLGRRLRYLRAQLGITQRELAQRAAMGSGTAIMPQAMYAAASSLRCWVCLVKVRAFSLNCLALLACRAMSTSSPSCYRTEGELRTKLGLKLEIPTGRRLALALKVHFERELILPQCVVRIRLRNATECGQLLTQVFKKLNPAGSTVLSGDLELDLSKKGVNSAPGGSGPLPRYPTTRYCSLTVQMGMGVARCLESDMQESLGHYFRNYSSVAMEYSAVFMVTH